MIYWVLYLFMILSTRKAALHLFVSLYDLLDTTCLLFKWFLHVFINFYLNDMWENFSRMITVCNYP